MLQLRPSCENCNVALPADSSQARICSFECTFCANCVANVLLDVCPNCGGNFCSRPVRPVVEHRPGVCLSTRPASDKRIHQPVDAVQHREFATQVLASRRN